MKFIDKQIGSFAVAFGFVLLGGGAPTAFAQDQRQDTRQQQEMHQNQDRQQDELNVDELFENVDQTDQHDIMDLLGQDENFSIFMELLEKSGIDAAIEFAEPVTVFAPTNDAFRELTVREYEKLMETEDQTRLNRVIKAHIMPQKVYSRDFETNQVITSAHGDEIAVGTLPGQAPGSVIIGGATIVRPDIEGSNGVIHIMNRVILPDQTDEAAGFGVY